MSDDRRDMLIREAWKALQEAGFYGSDSSTIVDGIRWLAEQKSIKVVGKIDE